MSVYALRVRIVSSDKILRFKNIFIIIITRTQFEGKNMCDFSDWMKL